MKNYITTEQFSSQSEKAQNELLEWCKNNLNEVTLVGYIGKNKYYKNSFPATANRIAFDCMEIGKEIIPLLQMHQLIQFIEDKTQSKLMDVKYCINPKESSIPQYKIEDINTGEQNLLQALWKATIEIIEDGE